MLKLRHLVKSSKCIKKELLDIFCFHEYYKLSGYGRILYFPGPNSIQNLLRSNLENKTIAITTISVSHVLSLILRMPCLDISFILTVVLRLIADYCFIKSDIINSLLLILFLKQEVKENGIIQIYAFVYSRKSIPVLWWLQVIFYFQSFF